MLWALFISPLLALASDQTRKLRNVTTTHSDYVSLHLDDMELSSIQELANDLSPTMNDCSQTSQCIESVILFASPQLLTGSKGIPIMNILLNTDKSALHMIVMDEVHIASQFGHRSVGIKLRYTSMPMNKIKKVINATMKGSCASPSTKRSTFDCEFA